MNYRVLSFPNLIMLLWNIRYSEVITIARYDVYKLLSNYSHTHTQKVVYEIEREFGDILG